MNAQERAEKAALKASDTWPCTHDKGYWKLACRTCIASVIADEIRQALTVAGAVDAFEKLDTLRRTVQERDEMKRSLRLTHAEAETYRELYDSTTMDLRTFEKELKASEERAEALRVARDAWVAVKCAYSSLGDVAHHLNAAYEADARARELGAL